MKFQIAKQSQNICIKEGCQRPIFNKKRRLCNSHYQKLRHKARLEGKSLLKDAELSVPVLKKREHKGEIEFIKNYFNHEYWIHEPAAFHLSLDGHNLLYTPDFYDGEREVFIEVSATRQAYHANKDKYQLFRDTFPGLTLEIRKPSGVLLDEAGRIGWK